MIHPNTRCVRFYLQQHACHHDFECIRLFLKPLAVCDWMTLTIFVTLGQSLSGCKDCLHDFHRHHRSQHGLRFPLPRPVGKPPDRAFLDRPVGFAARQEQCGGPTEGGLVADDEDGVMLFRAAVRPVDGGQQVGDVAARSEARVGRKSPAEGFCGLLAAFGGAGDDVQVLRGV